MADHFDEQLSSIGCFASMVTIAEAFLSARRYFEAGELSAAEDILREILAAHPNEANSLTLLGTIAYKVGKYDIAIELLQRALLIDPQAHEAYCNLGVALAALGRQEDAVQAYRRGLELEPTLAEIHNNLGNSLKDLRQFEAAIAAVKRAVELRPTFAAAWSNLGNLYQLQHRLPEAVEAHRRALQIAPNNDEFHCNLGVAFMEMGLYPEALAATQQAIALNPNNPDYYYNLGITLQRMGRVSEAIQAYQQTIAKRSHSPDAYNNLSGVYKAQGKIDEAIIYIRQAVEQDPTAVNIRSNLLFALQYQPGITLSELAAAHADFGRRYSSLWQKTEPSTAIRRSPGSPLRIGFLSPDFAAHPIGYFLILLLEHLRSHPQIRTICFSDRPNKDVLTNRLQAAAHEWHDVVLDDDEQLSQRIRREKIDILFDLAGHTGKNRILVFARKPAPLQVTWAGYVGTTGLQTMDFLLADRFHIPLGTEHWFQERVLRMPDGYVCYEPPSYAPPVSSLPALEHGYITFGCFNNAVKANDQVLAVWGKILQRVPNSRIIFKYNGWNDPGTIERTLAILGQYGIESDRIEFLGNTPHELHFELFRRVDIALDPFPYSGGLTTCEALWMGIPVVTCPQETFASRHSLSHLSNVGFTETIAMSLDDYIEIAVGLASNLPRLSQIRAELRPRMAASPLCDGKRFAQNFADLFLSIASG